LKKFLVTIFVLALAVPAGALLFSRGPAEPSADGHTLSEWLQIAAENKTERESSDAASAIRKIGTSGIPLLLEKLGAQKTYWRNKLDTDFGRHFFSNRWLNDDYYQRENASLGFSILGPQAAPAVPALARKLLDTNDNSRSAEALGAIGHEALPALRSALTNQSELIRLRAVKGLSATAEGARLAVPEILAWRHLTNTQPAETALERVIYKLPEEEALRVLTEYARDPRWRDSLTILINLRRFPTNGAMAAPLVLPFLDNTNLAVRQMATNTLLGMGYTPADALRASTNATPRPAN